MLWLRNTELTKTVGIDLHTNIVVQILFCAVFTDADVYFCESTMRLSLEYSCAMRLTHQEQVTDHVKWANNRSTNKLSNANRLCHDEVVFALSNDDIAEDFECP